MALPLALLPAAFKAGTGLYQMYQSNQMKKQDSPTMDIPPEIQQALDNQKMLAGMKELSGQSRMEDKLRGSSASAINAIKQMGGGGAGLGAAADVYAGEQRQLGDLGIAADQAWERRQGGLQQQLANMAGWKNQKQMFDLEQRRMLDQGAATMFGSGLQNISGGIGEGVQGYYDQKGLDRQDVLSNRWMDMKEKMLAGMAGGNTQPNDVGSTNYNPMNPQAPGGAINYGGLSNANKPFGNYQNNPESLSMEQILQFMLNNQGNKPQ